MAPFLLFVALTLSSNGVSKDKSDARFTALLLWIAYIAHQFEEHWIDLYGNVYAFKPYVNGMIVSQLGAMEAIVPPLSDADVFVINTSLVWLLASLALWRGAAHIFPTLCIASIVVVNATSHLGTAIMSGTYNPGLFTSVVMFLPLGFIAYVSLYRARLTTWYSIVGSLIWSVLAHIIMVGGIILTSQFPMIPEHVYFASLIVWSILPITLFQPNAKTV